MNYNKQELSKDVVSEIKHQVKLFKKKTTNTKTVKKDNHRSKFINFYFSDKYKL